MESRSSTEPRHDEEPARTSGPPPEPPPEPPAPDDSVDEVIAESFPASDPPQWWAGPPG